MIKITHAMVRAASESRARDDEGEFESLGDHIDYSGENKTHTVIRTALEAALQARGEPDLYDALQLCADMITDMFRSGHAHTDPVEGGSSYGSYYIGPGVLPKISAALAKARGEATA